MSGVRFGALVFAIFPLLGAIANGQDKDVNKPKPWDRGRITRRDFDGLGSVTKIIADTRGKWQAVSNKTSFKGDYYRSDDRKGNDEVRFLPRFGHEIDYRIYIWYPKDPTLASNVPVEITHSRGREVIIDSADKAGVTVTGDWKKETTGKLVHGASYLHSAGENKRGKSVRFAPPLAAAGSYQILLWYAPVKNPASNVPVTVTHAGGVTTLSVDQRKGAGTWVLLGTYRFESGASSGVLVQTADAAGTVVADAVKFLPTRKVTVMVNQRAGGGQWTYLGTYGLSPGRWEDGIRIHTKGVDGAVAADGVKFVPSRKEVIVDNKDAQQIKLKGKWAEVKSDGAHGGTYLRSDSEVASATFVPVLTAGHHDVYLWFPDDDGLVKSFPGLVTYGKRGGEEKLFRLDKSGAGRWHKLGRFSFDAGTSGSVWVNKGYVKGRMGVDAVKFVSLASEVVVDNRDSDHVLVNPQITRYERNDPHNARLVTGIRYPDSEGDEDAVQVRYDLGGNVVGVVSQRHPDGAKSPPLVRAPNVLVTKTEPDSKNQD